MSSARMSPWPTTAPRSQHSGLAAPLCATIDCGWLAELHGNRLSDGPIQRQSPRDDTPPCQPTARGGRPCEHATVRPRRSRSRRHGRDRSPIVSLVGDGARSDRAPRSTRWRPMQAHAPRRAPASAPLARSKRRPSRRHARSLRRRCAPTPPAPLPKTSRSATARHTPEIEHRPTQKERQMTRRVELPTLPAASPSPGDDRAVRASIPSSFVGRVVQAGRG